MMKEYKVGEKFPMSIFGHEVMLEVVPNNGCDGCFFDCDKLCQLNCSITRREDKTSVIFKEVIPTVEDVKNDMVAKAVSNVDFAYIMAHMTSDGEVKINTIGKPENIGQLKKQLLKILEEEK